MQKDTVLRVFIRCAVAALLLLTAVAPASAAAGFNNVTIAATPDAQATQESFPPDTAEIFIQADMVDIQPGSVVTITWLAVDTGTENPPNFRLDRAAIQVGAVGRRLKTSLPRPGAGWPPGSYSVRLAVNGQTVHRIDFTVD